MILKCQIIIFAVAIGYLGNGTWFLELNFSFVVTISNEE